jgi:hypothetical protein
MKSKEISATTDLCQRCGKDRGVEGVSLLSNSDKTFKICFPCSRAWLDWRDRETYSFMESSSDLDDSELK